METITEFNRPYEGSVFRITAADIKAIQGPYTDQDEITICVRFVAENISDNESDFGTVYINAYVDDVSTTPTVSFDLEDNLNILQAVAPGKRTEGYYCVEAPTNAKTIELHVPADEPFRKNYIVFVFDVPPVEVLDS